MKYKNIVFDLGRVLLDFSPNRILSYYLSNTEDITLLEKLVFQNQIWNDVDQGIASEEDVIAFAKANTEERLHNCIENIFHNWYMHFVEVNGAKAFVELLIKQGYRLYLLSNVNDKFFYLQKHFPLLQNFPNYVISCEEKIIKPNEDIYRRLLQKFNLQAHDCLFIDDKEENVLSAKNIGMQAVVFKNYEDKELLQYFE